jgi:hypothetical protein
VVRARSAPVATSGGMTAIWDDRRDSKEVMDDDEPPMQSTKFQWQTILAYLGASEEEITDVQSRMGGQWR